MCLPAEKGKRSQKAAHTMKGTGQRRGRDEKEMKKEIMEGSR